MVARKSRAFGNDNEGSKSMELILYCYYRVSTCKSKFGISAQCTAFATLNLISPVVWVPDTTANNSKIYRKHVTKPLVREGK